MKDAAVKEANKVSISQPVAVVKPAAVVKKSSKKDAKVVPVPLTTKEQKLAELLRRYKADEITPHEYHLGRAQILAEP